MSRRHRALMNHGDPGAIREFLNVSAQTGVVTERWMNPMTQTNVGVFKEGRNHVMEFNGTDSLINCGTIDTLVGDKSFVLWLKGYEYSGPDTYLIGNTVFALAFDTPNSQLYITSDGGGTVANECYVLPLDRYTCVAVVRTAAGLVDFYENGVLLYSGLDTGIPEEGTDIKINIEPTSFRGLMNDVRVYDGLLSAEEVSQLFTESRAKYILGGPLLFFEPLSLCSAYQAVYDSFTNKPCGPDVAIQNTWVAALVAALLWNTKKDVQYNFAIHTNDDGEAQKNWLNPGTYDCTLVNAPTFTAYEGFDGGGISYLDTNWNPTSHAVNCTQNSNSVCWYSRTDVAENKFDFGARTTYWNVGMGRSWGNTMGIYNHTAGLISSGANSDSRGMFISNRDGVSSDDGYRNKSKLFDGTQPATGIPDANMYILCCNNNGSATGFGTKQISCFSAGAVYNQTEVNNDTDAFETMMDAKGKGVIS